MNGPKDGGYVNNCIVAESVKIDIESKFQRLVDYIHNWAVQNNTKLYPDYTTLKLLSQYG